MPSLFHVPVVAAATALCCCAALLHPSQAHAQTPAKAPAAKAPAGRAAPKAARVAPPPKKPIEPPVPDASPDQVKAADMVFYGHYECEFNLSVDIVQSPKHAAYVDVKHGKGAWLMKPVLSSTGAIRLEDVRNETLMVQIASKSMLLNVVTGHRIVDACVSPRQRELIEEARAAKAAAAAEAASGSAPAATGSPALLQAPAPAKAASS